MDVYVESRPARLLGSRWGAVAMVVAGVLFVLYPAARPYSDVDGLPGPSAMAFASPWWPLAHTAAMIGFILLPAGLIAVASRIGGGAVGTAAVVAAWAGVGLVLPYYGAEAFALHALGERMVATGDLSLLAVVDATRNGGLQTAMFGTGLIVLAIGAVLAAVAVWRSPAGMSRWTAVPFAAGVVLILPQFFGPPWLRIAHGVLLGIGCVVVAAGLARAQRS